MTVNSLPSEKSSFTEVNLSEGKRKKAPRRLVYFSDGVLEEYSSDEEEIDSGNDTQPLIDPQTLSWMPYLGYMVWWLGAQALSVCDFLGEHLAWFFGITSPKFQYEIEQYEKMQKEEEELENHIKLENAGWTVNNSMDKSQGTVNVQPQVVISTELENKSGSGDTTEDESLKKPSNKF